MFEKPLGGSCSGSYARVEILVADYVGEDDDSDQSEADGDERVLFFLTHLAFIIILCEAKCAAEPAQEWNLSLVCASWR